MRVVVITQVLPVARGLTALLQALGHEPLALLCSREHAPHEVLELVRDAPDILDVVIPAAPGRIASLLRAYAPDVAVSIFFPWKIPTDALAVPRFGIINGHPSLLPRYRGRNPLSWAIRRGETELGFTFHRMDAGLDTGAILAQAAFQLGDEHSWDELAPKLAKVITELLPCALERVERGDPGDAQTKVAGEYSRRFEPEYVWIDWSSPVEEIRRKVQAWRFHPFGPSLRGALAELDGATVRVLRVSRVPAKGRAVECADGTLWIVESEAA